MTVNKYMKEAFRHIFAYFKVSSFFTICLKILYTQWFFLAQFCELVVIAVSLQLSARFANVSQKIERLSDRKVMGLIGFVC